MAAKRANTGQAFKTPLTADGLNLIAARCEKVATELRSIHTMFAKTGGDVRVYLKMVDRALDTLEAFEDDVGVAVRRLTRQSMLEQLGLEKRKAKR